MSRGRFFPPATVVSKETTVAAPPPEQKTGVPVPVKIISKLASILSPVLIWLFEAVKLAGVTGVGEEQSPPGIFPYPTPWMRGSPVVTSVTLKVTFTPPVADAMKKTEF